MKMLAKTAKFTYKSFRYEAINSMILRNKGQAFVALFIRLVTALGGKPTKGLAQVIKLTMANFNGIAATQGTKGLVKYLKVCTVVLQQYICGHSGGTPNEPRVSKTLSGIPRVLPVQLRNAIRGGRIFYFRIALTMLSLYRDFIFKGVAKIGSIINPATSQAGTIKMVIGYIPLFTSLFVHKVAPKAGMRHWLKGKFSYFPIIKSSPLAALDTSTSPQTLYRSAIALTPTEVGYLSTLYNLSAKDNIKSPIDAIETVKTHFKDNPESAEAVATKTFFALKHSEIGKLGFKQEAAGKVRVFAMIDPWSQWVLYPIHKGIFRILSRYPGIDGTFNQMFPLKRAEAFSANYGFGLFSMDLSTATDRLPIAIQTPLVSSVFGLTKEEGEAWSNLLVNRSYLLPEGAHKFMSNPPISVKYAVGQPMGGYSSWPMLAITHHLIVQVAA
jgi:hypothetical protein